MDLEANIIDLMSILDNDEINVRSYNDEASQKNDSNSDTFSGCDNNILIQATEKEAEKQIVPHYYDISDEEETSDTKR